VVTAPLVFCWRQPFRSQAEPDSLADSKDRRGVVLVHGFVCNRGVWNPWMRVLRERGIPFTAVNLEPPFGSIDRYPDVIDAAVRRLEAATGLPPVVVAHSMGGLAVRAWLARHAAAARVQRVVTVASPHRGTYLARWSQTPNGHEMKRDSAWLRALEAQERADGGSRFVCFFSHCDNIVFPTGTATLPGADNRHLDGTAHVHMVYHPEVLRAVLALVEQRASAAPEVSSGAEAAPARPS
jgi:triacylglycerol esterase/lipase EstA (alpha/beta hydrolase family)